jgi:hypothetical protein
LHNYNRDVQHQKIVQKKDFPREGLLIFWLVGLSSDIQSFILKGESWKLLAVQSGAIPPQAD